MPGVKISTLPQITLAASDVIPAARAGTTVGILGNQILDPIANLNTKLLSLSSDTNTKLLSLSSDTNTKLSLLSSNTASVAANSIVGAGTINYIPKFQTTKTLQNSQIFDNGTAIGIGTTTLTEKFNVSGNVYVDGLLKTTGDVIAFVTSDERLKQNITTIPNSLNSITKIRGVNYTWNENLQNVYKGQDVGVIAQDVENVLPTAVTVREDGYKAVKYEKIIPLLIEAVKDLSEQITELKKQINK